jgi:hypothetical protein
LRRNVYDGEASAIFQSQHVTSDVARSIEREQQSGKTPLADLDGTSDIYLKQCADKYLGTEFRKRGNPLYLAVLIGRVFCNFLPIVDDLLCYDKAL